MRRHRGFCDDAASPHCTADRRLGMKLMSSRIGIFVLPLCTAIAAIGLYAAAALAMPPLGPVGDWITANGHGVIEISPCGDALCGRIVGIDRAPAAPIPTDELGRPQCGLTIISDEKPDDPGTWIGEP